MKNLLINYVSAASGGAITYLKNITPYLLELENNDINKSLKIKILVNQKQLSLFSGDIDQSRIIVVENITGFKRLLWEYRWLPKIAAENHIDIIFTPYQVTKLVKSVKNVVMLRNMEPFTFSKYRYSLKTRFRNYLLKFQTINTLKNADKIIAVSSYVREYIINNGYSTDNKLSRIYHGRDESFNAHNSEDDKLTLKSVALTSDYVFTCGSLLPYRKCEDIINAFLKLENCNNVKLVVAGSGFDKKYASKLNRLSEKSDNILMLGHVSHDLMKVLFRNCHVFVTATETEACPNIAIEAMSSGCAILSSDIEPMPEMFAGTAELYGHGDVEQLSKKLADYLKSPKRINEAALKRVEEFSWKKCAHQTYNYLLN